MLQRSPTYVVSVPGEDAIANALRRWIGERRVLRGRALEERRSCRASSSDSAARRPRLAKRIIRRGALGLCRRATTSTPTSSPATTPGTSASASSPTPTSSRSSPRAAPRSSPTRSRASTRAGSSSSSGRHLDADVVVTATGLKLQFLGGAGVDDRRRRARPATGLHLQGDDARATSPTSPSRSATPTPPGR